MEYKSVEEVPEDFKHVISLFLGEQRKKRLIKQLHTDDFNRLFQVGYYLLMVSDEAIGKISSKTEFQQVVRLIENAIVEGAVSPQLGDILEKNISIELEVICSELKSLRIKILRKKASSYEYMISQGKDSDAKKLFESELSKPNNIKLKRQYEDLLSASEQIKNTSFNADISLITTKLSGEYPTNNIAYLICNPARLSLNRLFGRDVWLRFPMKWAVQKMSVASLYDVVEEFECGTDVSHYVFDKYNYKEGFDTFLELVDSLVVQHALGGFDNQRKQVLREIVAAYNAGHFSLCVYAALPMIEGLLWDIANYVQRTGGSIFNSESDAIVKGSEKVIKKPKIRQIVSETDLSSDLDSEFINYFCSELYDERNGALHGRVIPDVSAENAGKKIVTIEYLLDFIATLHQDKLFKHLENSLSSEYIDELLEKTSKSEG
ncbi:hypothetical protein [Photobacterium leiognathi]|uniref:hypothetical protein n=1 Tax=Photobacterium leiognathi TaxID=553611 RepID=UPI0029826B64|nr:hypothetical protein [Photobacterium leiognathi]EJN6829766.1 hypothetical protein [Vibrio cidicii]